MRRFVVAFTLAGSFISAARAGAQESPPRIGPFVLDLHGTVPMFPNDLQQLADSRNLTLAELPGLGIGAQVGLHVYFLRWRAITVGLGGEAMIATAHSTPPDVTPPSGGASSTVSTAPLNAVDERLTSAAPQLSLNFGTGRGWSYLSGGVGLSQWSIHVTGQGPGVADTERLQTVDYGGGARWFIKPHLAFSLDVRFYEIQPGSPVGSMPGSPRTRVLIMGAGISLK